MPKRHQAHAQVRRDRHEVPGRRAAGTRLKRQGDDRQDHRPQVRAIHGRQRQICVFVHARRHRGRVLPKAYQNNPRAGGILGQGGTSIPDVGETLDARRAGKLKKIGPYRVTRTMGPPCRRCWRRRSSCRGCRTRCRAGKLKKIGPFHRHGHGADPPWAVLATAFKSGWGSTIMSSACFDGAIRRPSAWAWSRSSSASTTSCSAGGARHATLENWGVDDHVRRHGRPLEQVQRRPYSCL